MSDIYGVEVADLDVHADERGHLTELYRDDWDLFEPEPEMAYYSLTYPGIVRAWHRHLRGQVDYFTCPQGRIKIAVCDDRDGSESRGELDTFVIGETNQMVVRIPGDCWHGFKALGTTPALLVNFPTELYDYDDPDEERLPHDTDEIPFDWHAEPHG